ncbi:dienelactone hydrolase family protein [Thermomonas haemolytica]|uniref:Carboxymethylenebutenolidase n=1 Tax=Thermomonas haemolytica TaxID=141949 RepID=A0A4R3N889_9GAMM|nr:dienelactone hydrolase family protein [Thermomonas haemolytica]TCT24406.1 carboxymethylenebutenolidase [Thermomonas haemolytica]TNY29345.1 carboxymethylenebutenolidase [Thermomonas haemolytica]
MGHWQALPTSSGPLQAWREDPQGTPRGAIVVVQEIFGITDHIRAVCAQLAEAGFVALAPAFFDRFEPRTVLPYDAEGTARGRELVAQLGMESAVAITAAAAEALQAEGLRVGVVGFCWGGSVALLAATRLGLPAVSYYGARNVQYLDEPARAPLLFHFGALDAHIPPEAIEAHRRKQPQAQVFVYAGADHAFHRAPEPPYHPEASALAWRRTLSFFTEHLR